MLGATINWYGNAFRGMTQPSEPRISLMKRSWMHGEANGEEGNGESSSSSSSSITIWVWSRSYKDPVGPIVFRHYLSTSSATQSVPPEPAIHSASQL